jgi:hypothetical protein
MPMPKRLHTLFIVCASRLSTRSGLRMDHWTVTGGDGQDK